MSKASYHSSQAVAKPKQAPQDELWRQEVGPRLPRELDEKAKELKAFERVRGIHDPLDLLRGLLA